MSTAEMINHELAACWEMCCEAVGIDTDATAAEWRETYEAERAQVQREAAAKALREAADELNKSASRPLGPMVHIRDIGLRDGLMKCWSLLHARADWMETEKLLLD